ncbi:MAG: Tic22 family protein [Cyanobacteria bacterium P01_H01_bin.130]
MGAFGVTLAGNWLGGALEAIALPPEQVEQILGNFPVFVVTDGDGAPLLRQRDNQALMGAFINPEDAESFLGGIKERNPELGNQLQITASSLAIVYAEDRKNDGTDDDIDVAYIPSDDQVEQAQKLLNSDNFVGVPLFFASVRVDEQDSYFALTRSETGQSIIPYFVDKEPLENAIAQVQERNPELAEPEVTTIRVLSLEGMIQMLEEDNEAYFENFYLVPSQTSLDYADRLRRQAQPQ